MNIRKFIAPTAREALREIRSELGEEAVILSNRTTSQGVEIVAMANDEMVRLSDVTAQGAKLRANKVEAIADAVQALVPGANSLAAEASILGEIKSMHSKLQKQIETLSWNNVQQRDPQRAGLLRRMLNSGFSTLLARQLLDKMPAGNEKGEFWIKQVLKRNLRVAGAEDDIVAKGGV